MKNFTLKMKSALLGMLAVFAMATPSNAKVTGVSDLFGKYKFTADIEYTEAGKAYEGKFKNNCDVVIEKEGTFFEGQIVGLAGLNDEAQRINAWDADSSRLSILNPNGQGNIWGGLTMSDASGKYPYGADGFSLMYPYNEKDGSITIPDFTLGTCDHPKQAFNVMVKFTNVKLTLVELEKIDITDLTGDWHFKAGQGKWDTMEESTLPTEFDMNLVAKDASFKTYTVQLKYGEFAPVNMDAEFNGAVFNLKLDSTALDEAEHIYLVADRVKFPENYYANLAFNYTDKGALSLSSGINIVRNDSISPEKPKGYLQWFMSGLAKRQGGDVAQVSWDGKYNMVAGSFMTEGEHGNLVSKEFQINISYVEVLDAYVLGEFNGNKIQGFILDVDKDNKNKATIKAGGFLQTVDPGKTFLALGDENGEEGLVTLQLNEDGSLSMGNCSVLFCTYAPDYTVASKELIAAWGDVKGTKVPVKPFSWAQTFNVTADVETIDNAYTYPTAFDMVVTYNEEYDIYGFQEFFGERIDALNYGGGFAVSETDKMAATINNGVLVKSVKQGEQYLVIADAKGETTNAINIKADAEGNLVFDDFTICWKSYTTNEMKVVAKYTNVKAVVGVPSAIENVEKETVNMWMSNGALHFDKAQAVQVYNISGKKVFSGVTAEVNGLVKGLYIVKTATGVAKVFVR